MHVFFTEDGQMDKRVFLATWKDIPAQNEVQYTLTNVQSNAGWHYIHIYVNNCLLHINVDHPINDYYIFIFRYSRPKNARK